MPDRNRLVAVIDAGTNSVHLVVAAAAGSRIRSVRDEKAYVGLGPAVERGSLGPAADALVESIGRFVTIARDAGADRIAIVGTEPLRRVGDADAVARRTLDETGIRLDVVSHEEEGLLTLLGVTLGQPVDDELLVADVGGGSLELVIASPGAPPRAVGLRLGSARLVERLADHDPPTREDVAAMIAAAADALALAPDASPARMVAVGGAATNLLAVARTSSDAAWLDRELIRAVLDRLLAEPAATAAERLGLHPVRARVLPAGGSILIALLDRYGVDRVSVSDASLREGVVLALARSGTSWRSDLAAIVDGAPPVPAPS